MFKEKFSHLELYFWKLSQVLKYNSCMKTACHSVNWKSDIISQFTPQNSEYIYISKVNFKCTLVCRHLVLRWKISSNKICRSQREQVRTSSTILFQISNFDSKLHLKRRCFFFKKSWILVCRLHPKMILPINSWLIIPNPVQTIQS